MNKYRSAVIMRHLTFSFQSYVPSLCVTNVKFLISFSIIIQPRRTIPGPHIDHSVYFQPRMRHPALTSCLSYTYFVIKMYFIKFTSRIGDWVISSITIQPELTTLCPYIDHRTFISSRHLSLPSFSWFTDCTDFSVRN